MIISVARLQLHVSLSVDYKYGNTAQLFPTVRSVTVVTARGLTTGNPSVGGVVVFWPPSRPDMGITQLLVHWHRLSIHGYIAAGE